MSKIERLWNEIQDQNAIASALDLIQKIDSIASKSDNSEVSEILRKEKKGVIEKLNSHQKKTNLLYTVFLKELEIRTEEFEKEIKKVEKSKEAVVSNNFFLEYKKNDLLLLTDNLEEAYEEISKKNKELQQQKEQISEQAENLKTAHKEILEKNKELETQKEAILDQAEYLYEANQTISKMHEEVQQQKEEILLKNEELVHLNHEKNNLIGIVAHDLKSPLNQINGLISILKMTLKDSKEDVSEYLNLIQNSVTRLSDMIGKILDLEAVESKKIKLDVKKLNLSKQLAEITKRYKIESKQKNINIHQEIEKDVYANLDQDYVDQVFENLISNAIKFSPSQKNIFINLSISNGSAVCEIKDEGPGLTEEDKKKIFSKYQKLSAKPTANESSSGLGLSIVKKYVEAMDGKIWCESKAGKGASFFVSFSRV